MLFVRNTKDPIYKSLPDLKSGIPINEWFNLSVYDESTPSQTAHEIESILKKIPESFLSRPPFDFKNFRSPYKQRTFNDIEDDSWFRQFFHSSRQFKKHYPLAILAFFDFSFLHYILEENPKMSMPRLPQNTASTPMDTKFTPWLIPYHILLWDSLSQPQAFTIIPCLSLS